jgi:hypothetical protein
VLYDYGDNLMSAAVSVDDPADGENAFLSSLQQGGETGGPDDAARFQRMVEANGASGNSIAAFPPSAMLEQLGNGFVSFPQGWVGGMIQAAMMSGAFGDGQKHHAEIRNQQVAAILYAALHDLAATYQLMRWLIINVLPKDWAFVAGRLAGSFFTMWASGISRLPTKGLKIAGSASSFVVASYGSAILAIAKGDHTLASILVAVMTGQYDNAVDVSETKTQNEIRLLDENDGQDIAPGIELLHKVLTFSQNL